MDNIGRRPEGERELKAQYREELMDQMSANKDRKLREKMASQSLTRTGLDIGEGDRNIRGPSQNEVNEFLLNQMAEKETNTAAKRMVNIIVEGVSLMVILIGRKRSIQ